MCETQLFYLHFLTKIFWSLWNRIEDGIEIIDVEEFEEDKKGKKKVRGKKKMVECSPAEDYIKRKTKPSKYLKSPYEKHLDENALHPFEKNLLSFAFSPTQNR